MSNGHIFEYLDYYLGLSHPPHYAVMVNGPWGIGKSFNVKNHLQKLKANGKKIAYVSLYGAKSTDDIAFSLLAALAPVKDNKYAKLGTQLAKAIYRRIGSGTAADATSWLPDNFCDLIVFDDLERAVLPPDEVLAFINTFVEHEGRRVLIIANEVEILEKEKYLRVREKVIGITFSLIEDVPPALMHFIANIGDEGARDFLTQNFNSILDIFAQSETHSLRVLDQSLRCWERVYKIIAADLRAKRPGMEQAFKLFLALALEVNAGRLQREHLTSRVDTIVAGSMIKQKDPAQKGTPLSIAQDRYPRIYLHDSILSDEVLIQTLCDGKIEPATTNASLSIDEAFVAPDEEPNWRKVWHGFLRETSEFENAFARLESEFQHRVFDDPGVILHVLGLRNWGARIGELKKSEAEVLDEGKAYIDDLRKEGRLRRWSFRDYRHGAFGLGFQDTDRAGFTTVYDYFFEQSGLAYRETWPALGKSLLEAMSEDAELFRGRVCWSGSHTKPDCADDPVLTAITPKTFVNTLLDASPAAQRTILEGLQERYQTGRLSESLAEEKPWLVEMHHELQGRIPALAPIRRYSLSADTKRLLGPALEQAKIDDETGELIAEGD
ncbi:P-loop NTPase fold protein [Hyphomicrobium sp.]|uniref:P-loop NTPase fold protein n=1 Tax=Hyphomicrobium sp. TaxID=82 RepID=UPI001DAF83C5|nr:P-loop NTPase fold protein [Hyphomicrobium sp.]MBY0559320.1 KAP family NTPase [Hyphomicrobium sp.]